MKKFGLLFFNIAALGLFLTFQNCKDPAEPTDKEVTEDLLTSKTTWVYSSVNVPANSATEGSDWENFSVKFNGGSMDTNGHANNNGDATVVWPSTTYTVSEDGKTISRGDGVDMLITSKTESSLVVTFGMPQGTEVSRIAALDGDYTFNLK